LEHVEAYDEILRPVSPQFLKDPIWWKRQPGQPESLLSAIDPERHAHMRRALAPGFTPRALRAQEPFIHRYVNLLVDRLRELVDTDNRDEIDIAPWLMFTTFDIFGDLGFGESFDCLQNSHYHPWIALLFASVKAAAFVAAARFYPWIEYALMKCIPPSLKEKQRNHFNQIVDKVRRRLNYEVERPDIMSHVIRDDEDSKQGLPLDEINVTFMVLTTAGSETTATVLTGIMNYLIQCPEKLDKVVAEIRGQFQAETDITLEALRNSSYLNAVINEGLRLCTPIPWVLPRQVPPGGGTVCGVWLPGGTRVSIQAYAMSRDRQYWHLSESYLPERWLPESQNDPKSPFFGDKRQALQPFSVGPRSCMGQHLAWAEMRLILAKLFWNFDFAAPEDKAKWLRWEDLRTFLLVEKRPVHLRARLRSGENKG
jgi:cytochrome P450